ncbi:MAG TPA: MGMT family protein [Candidatus Paceibacterota bacterium]|nr:MGMT family protein [Candidatus Paceibacterota bacterium]
MTFSFTEQVHVATRRIPSGRVATYKDIARAIGRPKALRAVGNALHANPDTQRTPCHRVVRSDGSVGGYAHGTAAKIKRLRAEDVIVERGRIDLTRFRVRWK